MVGRWSWMGRVLVTALVVMSGALHAQAAPGGSTAADEKRAVTLFEQSEEHYNQGRFEQAAELLEQAHALHPEPTLLYNLARAREGQGKLQKAATAYRAFLDGTPKARDRGAIEKRIESLEQRLAQQQRLEEVDRQAAQERQAAAEQPETRQPQPDEPADGDGSSWLLEGPLPWIILGIGVVGLGVGAGLGGAANAKHDDAEAEPVQTEAVSLQDEAEDLAGGATAALVAGGALAALGAALAIAGLVDDSEDAAPSTAETAWRFDVGPSAAQLTVSF